MFVPDDIPHSRVREERTHPQKARAMDTTEKSKIKKKLMNAEELS